jgi:hypothetical protein
VAWFRITNPSALQSGIKTKNTVGFILPNRCKQVIQPFLFISV